MTYQAIEKWGVPLFFVIFLTLGLWITPDYGIGWDEDIQRKHGRVAWDYVSEQLNLGWERLEPEENFREYEYNFHGTIFQMTAYLVQRQLNLTDYRDVTLVRHYGVFLLFFMSSIFFYHLLKLRFLRWEMALLGTAMLILSPRIFANAFFNVKDLVILSFYIMASFTMIQFLKKKNTSWAIWHGLACALVINARLMGVIVPFLTLIFLTTEFLQKRKAFQIKYLLNAGIFGAVAITFTILLWPYLWEKPLANFIAAFSLLSKYNWGGDVLYFNDFINARSLPWHYALGWIHITTPIAYLVLFWIGFLSILRNKLSSVFQKPFAIYTNDNQMADLAIAALFLFPVLIVIIKGSTLYDSWRHLFFIYPPMIYMAIKGVFQLAPKPVPFIQFTPTYPNNTRQIIALTILFLEMNVVLNYTVRNHPYQHTYFNVLAGTNIEKRFDVDYWGVAYQTALRELIKKDERAIIKVRSANYPCDANARMLPKDIRDRIELVWDIKYADYYLTNYRFWKELNPYKAQAFPFEPERAFLVVKSWNTKVIGVYEVGD